MLVQRLYVCIYTYIYTEKKCMYVHILKSMYVYVCRHAAIKPSGITWMKFPFSTWFALSIHHDVSFFRCANYLDIWANNVKAVAVALSRFSIFISVLFTFRSRRSTKLCKRHQFAKENKSEVSQICNKNTAKKNTHKLKPVFCAFETATAASASVSVSVWTIV